MNTLTVKNLRKTFKNVVAVDNVSFTVKKGEIFGLLGVNGAGKTTTINILAGLLQQDAGTVSILGSDPAKENEIRNKMNVSTAYFPLSDVLTIRQNLRIYAKLYGVQNPEEKINELLETFELTHLAEARIERLSSGEATRTALCKGLINDPEVLLLDECTVGLDPDIAEKTRQAIKAYHERTQCTILFTSHYMYEVEELCERIAFMEAGKIVTIASAEELKKTIKKHTVEVTVKNHPEKLHALLEEKSITVLHAKQNTIIFEVDWEDEKLYKTLNNIFTKGFHLTNLHVQKPTLDDIFITMARRKK
ncbi:MAG: ABC transporter ATP-binding protein [Candidatus Woesearchaeota archaeon]|nr:ABC transporter ATP-binding protein [Candidatus Woesearchaeota archaeon]